MCDFFFFFITNITNHLSVIVDSYNRGFKFRNRGYDQKLILQNHIIIVLKLISIILLISNKAIFNPEERYLNKFVERIMYK